MGWSAVWHGCPFSLGVCPYGHTVRSEHFREQANRMEKLVIAVDVPDTETAMAAAGLLAAAAPPFLIKHSYRTFCFGSMLVEAFDVDPEAAFVASLLHDLGLTEEFSGDRSFELVGADHAAALLEAHGWNTARIRLVERAIVRHADLEPREDPVERIVQAGAALDVAGIGLHDVDAKLLRAVVEQYPRDGFVDGILELYFAEIDAQPTGLFAGLEASVTLSGIIPHNPLCAHVGLGGGPTIG